MSWTAYIPSLTARLDQWYIIFFPNMGAEQGIVVSSSNLRELSSNRDLVDLRLFRAFKTWLDFKSLYNEQIGNIAGLSSLEIAQLANALSASMMRSVGFETPDSSVDLVSAKRIDQLMGTVSGTGNRVIFMRHGEQSPPEWISSISNPALRKIRMMQNPFNQEDLLTNKGLVETFTTALVLLHAQVRTGKRINVITSENKRALEVANIISQVTGCDYSIEEELNCIAYKDERDDPSVTLEALLGDLPDGNIPWNLETVDKWCRVTKNGKKPSEAIVGVIDRLCQTGIREEGNDLTIVVTHTQQLAEVLRFAGKLKDPAVRLPELSMIALISPEQLFVYPKGVLADHERSSSGRQIRKILEVNGEGYEWYKIRREEYDTGQKIPFLVSPHPFYLSTQEAQEVLSIGRDVVSYMHAIDELYHTEADVKALLDRGKPDVFQASRDARYLFVRPDLLVTKDGFSICEIETSPFGLALAELLNKSYRSAGFNTMVEDGVLPRFVKNHTPPTGSIVFSYKTGSYAGQLRFLADKVFSGEGRNWDTQQADFALNGQRGNFYRGFYQHEYLSDLFVHHLINLTTEQADMITPSYTPHMEEKAILALIWDKRWQSILERRLGPGAFAHLRKVIPLTWVIGEEQFFVYDLPGGIQASEGLATLPKSKRNFVLKKSGFGDGSSWGEGVSFLHEKSTTKVEGLLRAAQRETASLYIVQEFRKCQERPLLYDGEDGIREMKARIRMTPYFSFAGSNEGDLVAIKITGCENTNYIHASTGSVNTAVAIA